ncbi:isochorismatase family protein [Actinophytocola sp. NPDC049390]|uniref:isochorismatase family protein n=1 Tax=Actinophytocola sp. NPDC049390 TaxID=3363894 RepID=UPI0037AF432B
MSPLNLDPRRTAMVLIDLMPRIIALPTAPHSGEQVFSRCVRLADAFRARGGLVMWVRVERPGGVQPEGSELAVTPAEGDVVVVKHSWGAFGNSDIADRLREHDVETVVFGGIATNFGVESTARAADDHGYSVVLVTDAMAGLDQHAHDFAVEYVFPKLGVVVTTDALLAQLPTR